MGMEYTERPCAMPMSFVYTHIQNLVIYLMISSIRSALILVYVIACSTCLSVKPGGRLLQIPTTMRRKKGPGGLVKAALAEIARKSPASSVAR